MTHKEAEDIASKVVEYYQGNTILQVSKKFGLSSRHVLQILAREDAKKESNKLLNEKK